MTEREKDELVAAIAESIVARQGKPNRDRAVHILEVIEAKGWQLTRPATGGM